MRSGAYEGNEAVLGSLFGRTLTTDETVCLQSMCRAVLASGTDSVLDVYILQKIGDALRLLRGADYRRGGAQDVRLAHHHRQRAVRAAREQGLGAQLDEGLGVWRFVRVCRACSEHF